MDLAGQADGFDAARGPGPGPADGPGGPWTPRGSGSEARFDDLPAGMIVRAFGVDYAHLHPAAGGDLYVTRCGWPRVESLDPDLWYAEQWFARHGVKLPGSSGHVYHVRTRPARDHSADLVVKFSRMAQDVPVVVESTFPEDVPPALLAEARFNSPMEEFGLVEELRRVEPGGPGRRILTQRPLAIYVPPEEFDLWQLGRSTSSFSMHHHLLAADQDQSVKAIELDIKRIYVLLYGWIKGRDAEECFSAGQLSDTELRTLTARVSRELAEKGFRVLDNKPKHFILRPRRRDGAPLRRGGDALVYGLVDFELLQRTAEHQRRFKAARRETYWQLLSRPPAPAAGVPSHLVPVTLFGVPYIFGATPDGGRLWVVGREPGLFDYFLPDRWRRTPRVKLSVANEVYRTRTRDHVDLVYRMSRVGLRPRVDPLSAEGQRIREAGYNSPFEEVAIAERLREMGISTTYPRAIYRTGHESMKAFRLRDPRRITAHAEYRTPEPHPEPVLNPAYDYYGIWDTYRGVEPLPASGPGAIGGVVGLERARDDGLISAAEAAETLRLTRRRLAATGLPVESIADDEFVIGLDAQGLPRRDDGGIQVVLSLDALTAWEFGLLEEAEYLGLLARVEERLRAVDFEKLDPTGRHLLLTLDPAGRFRRDASGRVHATLSNFALIRGLYRPIR